MDACSVGRIDRGLGRWRAAGRTIAAARTGFFKPRDPIVANLLLDWATLNLACGPIENADALYDLAVTYGTKPDAIKRCCAGWGCEAQGQCARAICGRVPEDEQFAA
jgi:hypothetical protein